MVWYSHLFQNFPQFIVIHRVKGFGIVNKAEIDIFKKIRDTKGTFHTKKGSIKDRNGMDITEDIKEVARIHRRTVQRRAPLPR